MHDSACKTRDFLVTVIFTKIQRNPSKQPRKLAKTNGNEPDAPEKMKEVQVNKK